MQLIVSRPVHDPVCMLRKGPIAVGAKILSSWGYRFTMASAVTFVRAYVVTMRAGNIVDFIF